MHAADSIPIAVRKPGPIEALLSYRKVNLAAVTARVLLRMMSAAMLHEGKCAALRRNEPPSVRFQKQELRK